MKALQTKRTLPEVQTEATPPLATKRELPGGPDPGPEEGSHLNGQGRGAHGVNQERDAHQDDQGRDDQERDAHRDSPEGVFHRSQEVGEGPH